MKVDVLFIHPGGQKEIYQDLAKEHTAIAPPVWTSLLANFVRNKGYVVAIYDSNVEGWTEDTASKIIQEYAPELIVIMVYGHHPSASTQAMPAASRIVNDIKKYNKDIPIAMGGIHPSALPERTLHEENIDYVIQGEGPYTIEGLIGLLKGKCEIKSIPGLWYRGKDGIELSTPPKLVSSLDEELNGYAWDLLPDIKNYRAHNMHCFQEFYRSKKDDFSDVRSPYITLCTSLGCPFSCHYCCINAIFSRPNIRYWSIEKVLSWIDIAVNKYKVKNIRLDDELFILLPKRVERFCDMLIERKYDLNIMVYGRVDTIKEYLLEKIKKAGINWICLGIESASEKVRRNVNKIITKDIRSIVKMIQSHDIYVMGNFMFGLPEDDHNTMQETLNLAKELNCEFGNFYCTMAYPGSKLYEIANKEGWRLPATWSGYSQHSYETLPLPTKYLSSEEVLRFRDMAFHQYCERPEYLQMIEKRFSPVVKNYIEKMNKIKLKRKILGD